MSSRDDPPFKVVFINGPPRCGKDTAGQLIKVTRKGDDLGPTHVCAFSTALKAAVHQRLKLVQGDKDPRPGRPMPPDYYESRKDRLGVKGFPKGQTPSEAYIDFAENVAKPELGQDIFGRYLLDLLVKIIGCNEMVVITGVGFREECGPIIEHYGAENCLLIQMSRKGCAYKTAKRADSRGYVDLSDLGVEVVQLKNDYRKQTGLLEALRELGLFA